MFNLGFGSFPSSGGITSILSNPKIPHQYYMPELLSFRKNACCQKKGREGGGFSLFSLNESEQIEADQRIFQSMSSMQNRQVTDRFYLSEAAENISKLMDSMDSIKNNYPSTWERNRLGRFGHYCDTRTNLKRKEFGLKGRINLPESSRDSNSGNIWAPQFVTRIKSPNSIILASLSGAEISVNRGWDLCSHSMIQM